MTSPDSHFSRRAAPPSENWIRRQWIADWWPGIATGILVFAAITGAYTHNQFEMADIWHSPDQTGQATVVSAYWDEADPSHETVLHAVLKLRLDGQTIAYDQQALSTIKGVQPGDLVTVVYRTGKSGHIRVSNIVRLDAAAKQKAAGPASR